MKNINTDEFESFTVAGPGWAVTFHNFKTAKREYENARNARSLIGNRPDGRRCVIDMRPIK